jgi:hypothetical protein
MIDFVIRFLILADIINLARITIIMTILVLQVSEVSLSFGNSASLDSSEMADIET